MKVDKTLVDIPIYWCEEETFNSRYDEKVAALHERRKQGLQAGGFPVKPEYIKDFDRSLYERSMMPWRYNQVVGWIRIHKFGTAQLRGDFWLIKAERLGWQRKKQRFFHEGKAFEMFPRDAETNRHIYNRLMRHLQTFEKNDLKRIKKTSHCIVDLESFENIGRFVNWRRLMKWNT